jgi:hypothetical protein
MLASLVCGDPVYKGAAPSSNLHYFFMSGGFDPTPVTPISMNFVSYCKPPKSHQRLQRMQAFRKRVFGIRRGILPVRASLASKLALIALLRSLREPSL